MILWLFYLLRRAGYFLLGKRQFKVRVNTHPWAWFVPLGAPVDLPEVDLEITEAFGMTEAGVVQFVAGLRDLLPQARFTAANWHGEDSWDTRTFAIENAEGEKEKALLARLEQIQQEFLLTAQASHRHYHPENPLPL